MKRRGARKLNPDERAARIAAMAMAGIHDESLANACPVPRKAKKAVPPELAAWQRPEFIRSWRYANAFFDLMGAIEERDLARVKECQAKLLEDWGLVVDLAENWREKFPASPPESVSGTEAER
jgi:hypothetical protein